MQYLLNFSNVENKSEILNGHITFLDQFTTKNFIDELKINIQYKNEIIKLLQSIKGSFNFCVKKDEYIIFGVDHIRSRPLFYSVNDNQLIISDNALCITKRIEKKPFNKSSIIEFNLTGYVTGDKTLHPLIKQLPAGHFGIYNLQKNEVNIYQYHSHYSSVKNEITKEEALTLIKNKLLNATDNLLERNKDKTFILPISGGYDSRLIAYLLKLKGVKNVVMYSYGNGKSKDKIIGKNIAEKLKYPWIDINYNKKLWTNIRKTNSFKEYYLYANNLTSVPHYQDWPAVKFLKENDLIPKSAVFLPGHTPALSYKDFNNENSNEELANLILDKHYSLQNWRKYRKEKQTYIKQSVLGQLNFIDEECIVPEDVFATWELNERQSKFICNSTKAFEFFGYDWELLLWDKEFIDVWKKLPKNFKVEKWLIKMLISNLEIEILGHSNIDIEQPKRYSVRKKMKRESLIYSLLRRVFNVIDMKNDTLSWHITFGTRYLIYRLLFTDFISYHAFFVDKANLYLKREL